jgi:hypothetical protein
MDPVGVKVPVDWAITIWQAIPRRSMGNWTVIVLGLGFIGVGSGYFGADTSWT